MSAETTAAIRDLLVLRLKATAAMHAQVGAAAPQVLRKTFLDSAMLMMEAADEIKTRANAARKGEE